MRAKDGRKICSKCRKDFPATTEYFFRNRAALDGLTCFCKKCLHAAKKQWRKDNPKKYQAHKKKYRENNPEKCRVSLRKWRKDNREKLRAYAKKYQEDNREKYRAYAKKSQENNRERYNAYQRQYRQRRRETDPGFRLRGSISSSVSISLAGSKAGRSWEKLVGYTLKELQAHLESLFKPGMTWENYGSKWHIDHIRPISSFSFTTAEDSDFKECWGLDNLQPLWEKENIVKSDRWDGQVILPFAAAEVY